MYHLEDKNMKAIRKRLINCILCGALVLSMVVVPSMDVYADRTINEVQESIDHQKEVINRTFHDRV